MSNNLPNLQGPPNLPLRPRDKGDELVEDGGTVQVPSNLAPPGKEEHEGQDGSGVHQPTTGEGNVEGEEGDVKTPNAAAGALSEIEEKEYEGHTTDLPLTVLGCPDCGFLCTSNNQMCRHMFMTCHGVHACTQCPTRLICWAFAPGVQKLFVRAKKDGVMIDTPIFETADKHQERTGHFNSHVPGKERYVKSGKPEDYGLGQTRPPPIDTSSNRYNCPQCQRSIGTWTQMTKHLDTTKHSLCRCVECDVALKCYGMSQPMRHEKLTGHRGLIGLFRMKMDYLSTANGNPVVAQYSCEDCGIGYLHPLHIALHLHERHGQPVPEIRCGDCKLKGTLSELCEHRLTSGHENFVEIHKVPANMGDIPEGEEPQMVEVPKPLNYDRYLISLPSPPLGINPTSVIGVAGKQAPPSVAVSTGSKSSYTAVSTALPACKILYQCPTCFFIATTWPKFEKHLYATKHTLAHCLQCRQFLPPLLHDTDPAHRFTSGHKIMYGEQMARGQYESLVNLGDPDLLAQVTQPAESLLDQVIKLAGRMLYQCPIESCNAVFVDSAALHRHWDQAGDDHGTIVCSCHEHPYNEFSLRNGKWGSHTFDPDTTSPMILQIQKADVDFGVWATDEELVKNYSELFVACPECNAVLEVDKVKAHTNSVKCVVTKSKVGFTQKAVAAQAAGSTTAQVEELLCAGVLPIAPNSAPASSAYTNLAPHPQSAAATNHTAVAAGGGGVAPQVGGYTGGYTGRGSGPSRGGYSSTRYNSSYNNGNSISNTHNTATATHVPASLSQAGPPRVTNVSNVAPQVAPVTTRVDPNHIPVGQFIRSNPKAPPSNATAPVAGAGPTQALPPAFPPTSGGGRILSQNHSGNLAQTGYVNSGNLAQTGGVLPTPNTTNPQGGGYPLAYTGNYGNFNGNNGAGRARGRGRGGLW